MSGSEANRRLYAVMGDVLGVDPSTLSEDSSPDTVEQWDSLNHLMLMTALEGEFGISISIDQTVQMRSIADIRAGLAARGIQD